jgi:hypothetical protein
MVLFSVLPVKESGDSVTLGIVDFVDADGIPLADAVVGIDAAISDLFPRQPPALEPPLVGRTAVWNNHAFMIERAYLLDDRTEIVLSRTAHGE